MKLINKTRAKRKLNVRKLKKINARYFDLLILLKSLLFIYFLFNISYLLIPFFSLSLFIFFLLLISINERFAKKNTINESISSRKFSKDLKNELKTRNKGELANKIILLIKNKEIEVLRDEEDTIRLSFEKRVL